MNLKSDRFTQKVIRTVRKNHKTILGIAIIYFLSNCFLGLDFTDGFFHINAATLINKDYPFETILTGQFIYLLHILLGKNLILYRLFNGFILLTGFLIISKGHSKSTNKSTINLLFASFLIIGAPVINNILGYDSLSLFMLIVIVTFLHRIEKFTNRDVIMLSVLIGLFILIRIPNAIIIPLLFVYLLKFKKENNWNFKKTGGLFILISAGAVTFYCAWLIINYGSMRNAFSTFSSVNDHDFGLLFKNYLRDGTSIVCYLLLLIASYFLNIKNKKSGFLALIIIQFIFLFSFIYNTPYAWNYTLFLTAFNVSFVFINFIKEKKINYFYLFAVLATVILSIGSNTGLSKTSSFGTFGFLFCIQLYQQIDKKHLIAWLIVLIPFSFFENACWTYEDGSIFTLRRPIKTAGLNPVLTTSKHFNYIHAVTEKSDSLKKEGYLVFYYGYYSHLFTFLNPIKREYYTFDQRFGSTKEINSILKEYHNYKIAIFITDNIGYQKRIDTSLVEKSLLKNQFFIDKDDRFTIYTHPIHNNR